MGNNVTEVKINYSDKCQNTVNSSNFCDVTFDISQKMKPPIHFYYELENFYQNHQKYVDSRDPEQLLGKIKTVAELSSCEPVITMKELNKTHSWGNILLDQNAPANPCGLVAQSFFNDTFRISNSKGAIEINEKNIAWDSDMEKLFKKAENSSAIQWIDPTNEHFVVWMRTAALPTFRKLWGRINKDLEPGTYTLTIKNNYPVSEFNGKKSAILTTLNSFGGKNSFLATAYLVIGTFFLLMALGILMKKVSNDPDAKDD